MSDSHFDSSPAGDGRASEEPIVQPLPLTRRQRIARRLASPRTWSGLSRPRIRWPRLLYAAVVLLVIALGGIMALLNSPLLDIASVEVEGASAVSPASVRQLAGLEGEHVLFADLDAAQQRLSALTMVKEATISRDWPNGIKVVIVERTPWGRWRANNTVWAIDSDGVVLEGPAPPFDGPIITQISALPLIAPGARVDTTAVDMVHELDQLGAPLSLPAVLAYEWTLVDGLAIVTEHGRIIFGGAEGLGFKYHVWDLLEQEAHRRGEPLLFADLRFGLRPRVEIGFNVGRGVLNHDSTTADLAQLQPQSTHTRDHTVPSQQ